MRKLDLTEWENKYISGSVERFNQGNTMYTRTAWDESIKNKLDDWGFSGAVSDKPGYTLQDISLRYAVRHGVNMGLFNTTKPNTAPLNTAINEVLDNPKYGGRFTRYRSPDGAKVDTGDPQKMSRDIKKAARFCGASIVGICKLDRRFVYSHTQGSPNEIPPEYEYAVVMGFEEDYELLKYFPSYIADAATSDGYAQMAVTNSYLSEFIRGMGYKAIDCTTNDVALSIPMAIQAGLGDIGRNGLLISREFGPRLRLSKVITNLPLVADEPIDFGVIEFCESCKKCAKLCPSQSISYDTKRTAEPNNISNAPGGLKWPLNAETCRMYWGRMGKPCTACISVCSFNKDMTGWFHKLISWCVDHARWADSMYVKMDDWFGYGKPQKADDFWEKWQPRTGH